MLERIGWWIHALWGRYKLNRKLKKMENVEKDV